MINFSHNIVGAIDLSNFGIGVKGRDSFWFLFKTEFLNKSQEILRGVYLQNKARDFKLVKVEIDALVRGLTPSTQYSDPDEGRVFSLLVARKIDEFHHEIMNMGLKFRLRFANILLEKTEDSLKKRYLQNTYDELDTYGKFQHHQKTYEAVTSTYGSQFEHYFKNIETTIDFVDNSQMETEKWNYIKILLSQLSNYEIIGLFYYCVGTTTTDKLIKLIDKFDLFKEIKQLDLIAHDDFEEIWDFRKSLTYK